MTYKEYKNQEAELLNIMKKHQDIHDLWFEKAADAKYIDVKFQIENSGVGFGSIFFDTKDINDFISAQDEKTTEYIKSMLDKLRLEYNSLKEDSEDCNDEIIDDPEDCDFGEEYDDDSEHCICCKVHVDSEDCDFDEEYDELEDCDFDEEYDELEDCDFDEEYDELEDCDFDEES